tara:strand:- start:339 stop:623 length:285 start_codon:yes stop_codon:yes gene_type:complete
MKNKLRDKIKQDMIDLQNRLDKLNFWEESGYTDQPCIEHTWVLGIHATPTHSMNKLELRYGCAVCGMTMIRHFEVTSETLLDEWAEYREGGEEE